MHSRVAMCAGGVALDHDQRPEAVPGTVVSIQDYCIHDGPGIRTTVFLKGCPLRCRWCSNPESINAKPELGFIKARCDRCGKCAASCPERAITLDPDGAPQIDRRLCTNCGDCVAVCLPGALTLYGEERTVGQLFESVRRDEIFYRNSGGGVTVSGGEPLQQPELVSGLFQLCREAGIHTAIDTSGYAAPDVLRAVLAVTDLVLFDLKHMDSQIHQKYTGRSNKLILDNARLVIASKVPIVFRLPLIPGINDTPSNIQQTVDFIKDLGGGAAQLDLLPYHRLALGKYEALGRTYRMKHLVTPDPAQVEAVRKSIEAMGVECTVSG